MKFPVIFFLLFANYLLAQTDTNSYEVKLLKSISSEGHDFAPCFLDSTHSLLAFTRTTSVLKQSQFDVYYVETDDLGNLIGDVKSLPGLSSPDAHESGPTYFRGKLISTKCPTMIKKTNTFCRIHSCDIDQDNNVSNCVELDINIGEGNIGQVSVSEKIGLLVFSARLGRENSIPSNIWYCTWDKVNQKWSIPILADENINNEKDGHFPFITDDGTLYFTSMRGNDKTLNIYKAEWDINHWKEPIKLNNGINSDRFNELGFIIDAEKGFGYFVSNRPATKGKGANNIYHFRVKD